MADLHAKSLRVPRLYTELDGGGAISADVDCPEKTRGILIGVAGTISARMADGIVTSMPVQVGFLPGEFLEILASGTTAEDIWAVT